MIWLRIAIEFVGVAVGLGIAFYVGYRRGYTVAYDERLADLAKNARRKANEAQAEVNVLDGVLPPRVRVARIKGTSRQGRND